METYFTVLVNFLRNDIYVAMRVIALIVIMMIGLSGFTAAAHAFADMNDHAKAEHVMPDDDGTTSSDCSDCTHCCVSHAITPAFGAFVPLQPAAAINPMPVSAYSGNYYPSLLRPPKTLA